MKMGRDVAQLASDDKADLEAVPSTLAETAYQHLRRDIVAGIFAPGQPLRLELLKQRYGFSFSPLREALNRLQMERLVVAVALRGFSVAPLSIEEMWDATETRILIESEALRLSIRNGGDAWESGIVAAYHALDLQVRRMPSGGPVPSNEELSLLEKRHQDFHRVLISSCRSRRLVSLADQLYVETQRYRLPTLAGTIEGARDVPLEHQALMVAALGRSTDKATELLAEHYRRTAEDIERNMPAGTKV